jgi:hypothetical protein
MVDPNVDTELVRPLQVTQEHFLGEPRILLRRSANANLMAQPSVFSIA